MKKTIFIMMLATLSILGGCQSMEKQDNIQDVILNLEEKEEKLLLQTDISYMFIEDRLYEDKEIYDHSNFNIIKTQLKNQKGLIGITKADMYEIKENIHYFFVPFDPKTAVLRLKEYDDQSYRVEIESDVPIKKYIYFGDTVHTDTVSTLENGKYCQRLYEIKKETLESIDYPILLYNLKRDEVKMKNDLSTIDFRGVFTWEKNELTTLAKMRDSYKQKEGHRYTVDFAVGIPR